LLLIFFAFGIIFGIFDVGLILIGQKAYFIPNFLYPFVVGALSSFFVSFIFIKQYFKSNVNLKFDKSFGQLIGEIRYNHSMAAGFGLHAYIQQARDSWLNHNLYWIPEKHPSFTPWSAFFYQYFPVNAYYYFINQEFIIDNRLGRGLSGAVGRYNIACIGFSQATQQIENDINLNLNIRTPEQIEQSCNQLRNLAEFYLPQIETEYNLIMANEMVRDFMALHPDLIIYE
jgi:hypothetical protein